MKHDCSKDVQILTNTIGYDYIGHNSRILLIHNKDASSKWFPIQGLDVPLAAVQVLLVLRFEDGGVETRERRKLGIVESPREVFHVNLPASLVAMMS